MTGIKSLAGNILVAQPKSTNGHFQKSVVLVAQHGPAGAWGVVCNKESHAIKMENIMAAAGVEFDLAEWKRHGRPYPVYLGGPVEQTRVHVIHSMDWFAPSTIQITPDIGITGEMSVLAALAEDQGPKIWRAGVGLAVWSAGQLDGEQSGIAPWTPDHQWLTCAATTELVLTGGGDEQWQRAIDACVTNKIAELF
jgi:putative transcriptional regulator